MVDLFSPVRSPTRSTSRLLSSKLLFDERIYRLELGGCGFEGDRLVLDDGAGVFPRWWGVVGGLAPWCVLVVHVGFFRIWNTPWDMGRLCAHRSYSFGVTALGDCNPALATASVVFKDRAGHFFCR